VEVEDFDERFVLRYKDVLPKGWDGAVVVELVRAVVVFGFLGEDFDDEQGVGDDRFFAGVKFRFPATNGHIRVNPLVDSRNIHFLVAACGRIVFAAFAEAIEQGRPEINRNGVVVECPPCYMYEFSVVKFMLHLRLFFQVEIFLKAVQLVLFKDFFHVLYIFSRS